VKQVQVKKAQVATGTSRQLAQVRKAVNLPKSGQVM
jgi:hypothetical protein